MFARISLTFLVAVIFGILSVQSASVPSSASGDAPKNLWDARWLKSADNSTVYAVGVGNPNLKPMIFIHGFGCNLGVFRGLFENRDLLSKHYLIAYDTRGHGRSGKPDTAAGYESKHFAEDFKTVLEAFDLHKRKAADRPVVVGWSLGGVILADITAHLGHDLISGYVYSGAMPYMNQTVIGEIGKPLPLSFLPAFQTTDDVFLALSGRVKFVESCFNDPMSVDSPIYTGLLGSSILSTPKDIGLIFGRTQQPDGLWAAGKAGLPLYILYGTEDKHMTGAKLVAHVKPYFKNLEHREVQGGSHTLFYEHEDIFVESILGFAKRVQK